MTSDDVIRVYLTEVKYNLEEMVIAKDIKTLHSVHKNIEDNLLSLMYALKSELELKTFNNESI